MSLDLAGLFADAGLMLRRDRALLPWIAAPFLMLPSLALVLFLPDPVVARDATDTERMQALLLHLQGQMHWLLLVQFAQYWGMGALLALYLDADAPSIGTAIGRALGRLPGFAAIMLLASAAILSGLLLIVPGLYLIGRLFLLGPVLVAERDAGLLAAFPRAVELTRGRGWLLVAAATLVYVPGQLVVLVAGGLRPAAGFDGIAADVATFVAAGIGSAAGAAISLMLILLQIAAYRALTGARQGI